VAKQGSLYEQMRRQTKQESFKDPLRDLGDRINFESFRSLIETGLGKQNKGAGGRPAFDVVLMFKVLVIGTLYNLSDDALEMRLYDSHAAQRFLGLHADDRIPDAKTIWAFRESLIKAGVHAALFNGFNKQLERAGVSYSPGRIIDATIIEAPKQRNSREENDQIKQGKTPEQWHDDPAMLRQKDVDARWTQKHGRNHYGYKDHVKVDLHTKLIISSVVTPANVHDSQVVGDLLDPGDEHCNVYMDSAYVGHDVDDKVKAVGARNRVIRRRGRGKQLSEARKKINRIYARNRCRGEHVFGTFVNDLKTKMVRSIGLNRARGRITLLNLVYNMRRALSLNGRTLQFGWQR
jgi:IS5 family transposase